MNVLEAKTMSLTADDMRGRVRHQMPVDCSRTPGVHLSGVLDFIAGASGLFKTSKTQPGADFEENYPTIMAMGVAWEEFAAGLYPDMAWQPGEWQRDEIYGTPDGLSSVASCAYCQSLNGCQCSLAGCEDSTAIVEEFKFTTKKLQPVEQCWKYVRQGMGYCAMSGFRHVRYHVCWAHGDYSGSHWPIYTRTLLEFSEEEIEKFWRAVILPNKAKARREEAKGE